MFPEIDYKCVTYEPVQSVPPSFPHMRTVIHCFDYYSCARFNQAAPQQKQTIVTLKAALTVAVALAVATAVSFF